MAQVRSEIRERYLDGAPFIRVMPSHHTTVKRHTHDFFELVYIRDGFCLHDVDEKMKLVTEGDLFLLRPGMTHCYIGTQVVNIYNCLFCAEALEGLLKEGTALWQFLYGEQADYAHIHLDLTERKAVSKALAGMQEEAESRRPDWECKVQALLTGLLVDCARMYAQRVGYDRQEAGYTGYVTPALAYIDSNYGRELTVLGIAQAVGVSADYLTRQFKQVTGITPLNYLRRYRFARAMDLLLSDRSVAEVAGLVGYRNLCHFSREFKKEMGVTPSQYRKQNH